MAPDPTAEQTARPSPPLGRVCWKHARRLHAWQIVAVVLLTIPCTGAPAPAQARDRGAGAPLVVTGKVCARATGKAVAGAQVGAQGRWATAGQDGTYSLHLQSATRLPIRAAAIRYQSTDVITIYNPDGGPLSGQIGFSFCGNSDGLVEAFRSADGAVRLASFPQQQPGTSHTIVVTGTSTVALENDPALQLPSGKVSLLTLSTHGRAIRTDVPLTAGDGRYLLEINAAAGFALIKLPIFVGSAYAPPPGPAPFTPDPTGATTGQLRTITLDTVNRLRAHARLSPLQMDRRLNGAAQGHSDDMARHGFVGHYGSNGSRPDQRVRAAGVPFSETAEDVGTGDSVQAVIEGLMDSPAHRWAILGDFRLVGIGIAHSHDTEIMTLDFVRQ